MDLKKVTIDYENQPFEDMDVNPYEIVIAVSKKAREINYKAMKYLGPEAEIKPISIALTKLQERDISFTYTDDEQAPPAESKKKSSHEK